MDQTTNADANAASGQETSSLSQVELMSSPDYVASVEEKNDGGDGGKATDDGKTGTDEAKDDATKEEGGEKKDDSAKTGQETRFDQHPDWQRMMKERDSALQRAANAEGKLEAFSKIAPKATAEEPPYKDITKMSADELTEWQADDPVGFASNLAAMIRHQVSEEAQKGVKEAEDQQTMRSINETFAKYEKDNPDFTELWNKGEIEAFMRANPGHNAISAHMILTSEARTKALVDAAVSKANKETEERVTKNFMAKRNAAGVGSGPAHNPDGSETPSELKDTKAHGGLTAVSANRLRAMRRGAG